MSVLARRRRSASGYIDNRIILFIQNGARGGYRFERSCLHRLSRCAHRIVSVDVD